MRLARIGSLMFVVLLGIAISANGGEVFTNNLEDVARGFVVTFSEPVELVDLGGPFANHHPSGKASTFSFSGGEAQAWDSCWTSWVPASANVLDHVWLSAEPALWGLLDHAIAKEVDPETQYPTKRTSEFTTEDYSARAWFKIGPIYGTHTAVWEWFAPDGTLYKRHEAKDIGVPGRQHDWWAHYATLVFGDMDEHTMLGEWRVEVYMDGELMIAEQFSVSSPAVLVEASITLDGEPTEGTVIFFKRGYRLLDVLRGKAVESYVVPTTAEAGVHRATAEIEVERWQVLAMKPTGKDNEYWISDTKTLTFFQGFSYVIELPLIAKMVAQSSLDGFREAILQG